MKIFFMTLLLASVVLKPVFALEASQKRGELVYKKFCNVCHHETGVALQGGFVATGQADEIIKVILYGKTGSKMPGFYNNLTANEVADVIVYIRNSWGNNDKLKYGVQAGSPVDIDRIILIQSKVHENMNAR